jgi:hypothetical protein
MRDGRALCGLAALFLDLDHDESVGFPDNTPTLRALRLVPGSEDPKFGRAVVNFVLLSPRNLNQGRTVGSTALAPAGTKGVKAVLSRLFRGHRPNLTEGSPVLAQP